MAAAREFEDGILVEYYPLLKLLHVASVVCSGCLFVLRGIGVQAGATLAMAGPVRYLSYAIDSLLLGTAIGLIWALEGIVLASSWLWMKLALLPVYIVLGSFALKRAPTLVAKRGFFIAAIVVFLLMYRVARSHDPLGGLGLFIG